MVHDELGEVGGAKSCWALCLCWGLGICLQSNRELLLCIGEGGWGKVLILVFLGRYSGSSAGLRWVRLRHKYGPNRARPGWKCRQLSDGLNGETDNYFEDEQRTTIWWDQSYLCGYCVFICPGPWIYSFWKDFLCLEIGELWFARESSVCSQVQALAVVLRTLEL
jgi:NAD-dependent dihydropyrimidine dehydrogenase PreA subunit